MTDPAQPISAASRRTGLLARIGGGGFAVFERDLLVATSRRRYVALRSVIVALAAISALWIICVAEVEGDRWLLRNLGTVLFTGPAVGSVVLAALLGPAMTSDSIAGERVLETLPITLAAPMRPFGFVFAKFASRVVVLLVPMIAVIPVAALGLAYGGVRAGALGDYAGFLVLTACLAVAAGVLASAFSASVARATLLAYFLALVVPALELGICAWVNDRLGILPNSSFLTAMAHNPYVCAWATVAGRGGSVLASPLLDFAAAVGVCTAAAMLLAAWRVSREFRVAAGKSRRVRSPRPIRFDDGVLHRAAPRWFFLPSGAGAWLTTALVWGAAIAPPFADDWSRDATFAGMHVATWVTFLVTLVRSSQAFAPERQSGALGLLLVTPAGEATRLVRAHAAACAVHALRLLLPALFCGALLVIDSPDERNSGGFAAWCVGTPVLVLLAIALGLWRSSVAGSSGTAIRSVAFALFVPMAGWGLLWGAILMLVDAVGRVEEELAFTVFFPVPPAGYSFLTIMPLENSWNSGEAYGFACGCAWALLTVLGALAMLRRTVHVLDQRLGE